MRRLVVRGVIGGVVWVRGGGHRCRVWSLVMGLVLVAAARGNSRWFVSVGASQSIGRWGPLRGASVAWSRRGGCGGGGTAGGGGGRGGCCAGWGSGRPNGSCRCCVCTPCSPCGPWLVAVPRWGWEAATLLASGLLLGGPGAVGLEGVGHGDGGIGPRSSRPRCGVGVGCGGAGVCCPWPWLLSTRGPPRPPRSTLRGGPGGRR